MVCPHCTTLTIWHFPRISTSKAISIQLLTRRNDDAQLLKDKNDATFLQTLPTRCILLLILPEHEIHLMTMKIWWSDKVYTQKLEFKCRSNENCKTLCVNRVNEKLFILAAFMNSSLKGHLIINPFWTWNTSNDYENLMN